MTRGGDLRRRAVCGLLAACGLLSGCVRQRLSIRSEPPGAQVFLNDRVVGATPYDEPFDWYGWYRVTLIKPDYEDIDDRTLVKAPVYLWIPFDLVTELLPWKVRVQKSLSYTMTPKKALSEPKPPVQGRTIDMDEKPASHVEKSANQGATP